MPRTYGCRPTTITKNPLQNMGTSDYTRGGMAWQRRWDVINFGMRDAASPGDTSYKLLDLAATPLLFRVRHDARLPLSGAAAEIARYFAEHAGASVSDLHTHMPASGAHGQEGYQQARAQVARLVKARVLEICGEMPLEEVDPRYERVHDCDLCGASSGKHPVVLWKHNTPVVRCTSCGLLYANPRWKGEFLSGRYTGDYWELYEDKLQSKLSNTEANQERTAFYLWTLEHAFSTGNLLDVGCATGEFLAAAIPKGWQVYGVETSPASAEAARTLTGGQIHTGTLDTAPFQEGTFDAVTMFDVIEHLQSPRAYMKRIASLLRPGGLLAISTPNIHSVAYRLLGRRWEAVGPNDHLYYFSPRTLQRLLADQGFTIHLMRSEITDSSTWKQILRLRALAPLSGWLARLTGPFVTRFMLGDGVYVVARLTVT